MPEGVRESEPGRVEPGSEELGSAFPDDNSSPVGLPGSVPGMVPEMPGGVLSSGVAPGVGVVPGDVLVPSPPEGWPPRPPVRSELVVWANAGVTASVMMTTASSVMVATLVARTIVIAYLLNEVVDRRDISRRPAS